MPLVIPSVLSSDHCGVNIVNKISGADVVEQPTRVWFTMAPGRLSN
jgi:hypothetical protein